MKQNENGLDEMQRDRRNAIGNQMFIMMFYFLFLEIALNSIGVKWLAYPANIMVILSIVMSIYLVRIIAANAYLPPKAHNSKTIIILVFAISISWAIVELFFSGKFPFSTISDSPQDNSAIILFIISIVGLVIAGIATLINKFNDKNDGEN